MTPTPTHGQITDLDRFAAMPDRQTLDATIVALEEHGISTASLPPTPGRGERHLRRGTQKIVSTPDAARERSSSTA
jgi:hypothetical protein